MTRFDQVPHRFQQVPPGQWLEYFRENARSLMPLPWDTGACLTDAEREAITTSIQEFQLGESSEGKHLIGSARRYAARTGDAAYLAALIAFIGEEHRHARDLGRFMDLADIPRIARTWPDTVFRFLRKRAGLELSITVLVTAEIIAKVYYTALRDATGSPLLRRLCDQILRDEVKHVHFQTERVAILRRGRRRMLVYLCQALHRIFMAGTCLVVWRQHRRAFRAGRYSFARFWHHAWVELRDALRRTDPGNYRLNSETKAAVNPAPPLVDAGASIS